MGKTKDIRAAVEDELIFDPLVDSSDTEPASRVTPAPGRRAGCLVLCGK